MYKFILTMLFFFSFFQTNAEERKTHLNTDKKYFVSQADATQLLLKLKITADTALEKRRPPTSRIATFNGGTAKTEEPFSQRRRPCWADEDQFFNEIQLGLIYPWVKSWENKNVTQFNEYLNHAKFDKFAITFKSKPEKLGDIEYYKKWDRLSGSTNFTAYLDQFSKIESFDLVTTKYTSRRDQRDKDLDMNKADLHILFDLRGITKDGKRRNDRGPIKVSVAKINNVWKIQEIENWGLETIVKKVPSFQENTVASGVGSVPEYQRLEAIRRGGYAIAIGDANGDGYADMYLGSFGPGKLLLGSKDGSFSEPQKSGLENETLVKAAAFADFNNDGLPDLLLTRFVPSTREDKSFDHDIIIYQNLGAGSFKKIENFAQGRSAADNAMPAAIGDFNADGLLDFYVGFPGTKDFTHLGKLPDRKGIRAQGVYLNLGHFKFSENNVGDFNTYTGKFDQTTAHQRIYPHSAVAFDFDQDGDTDIMVIDDQGNISPAYQNVGKGKFIQADQHIGIQVAGAGMGMAAADIDNNGVLDMVFSNVNFTNKLRIDESCHANWNAQIFGVQDNGLKFYYGMKKGQFADATTKNGLFYAGEGLAGVEFFDYNNDGFQDLYVANGLWSGTQKDQDLSNVYIRSKVADDEHVFMEAHTMEETTSDFMKILAGFKGDLFKLDDKKSNSRPQLGGFQRNRLFRNLGDGSFIEVGYVEGVDSVADGYVISKADLYGTGRLDLILRNGDPGSQDIHFPAVQVFKNNSNEGKAVRLKLVGSNSNKDGIGASVTLEAGEFTQYQQLVANNGAAQSEQILHFGIGKSKTAKKVTVTWPSGKVTKLENLEPGLHVIREDDRRQAGN